jgi:hypothetical protein
MNQLETNQEQPLAQVRWPWWKIALAYAIMFAVAILSIWTIDGHVMKLSQEQVRESGL